MSQMNEIWPSVKGPYRLIFKKAEACDKKLDVRGGEMEIHNSRTNRHQPLTVSGRLDTDYPINDDIKVSTWTLVAEVTT